MHCLHYSVPHAQRSFVYLSAIFFFGCAVSCFGQDLSKNTHTKNAAIATYSQTTSFAELAKSQAVSLPNFDYEDSKSITTSQSEAKGIAEFVALSLLNSPQVRQAQAQVEASQAKVGMARADLLPNASIRKAKGPEESSSTVAAIPSTGVDKHKYSTKSYRLTQPLFNATAFNEFDSSRHTRDAASLRMDAVREATALSAVKATIDLSMARLTIDFADIQIEHLNTILSYLEARALAGASSQADLERARTRVFNAKQTRLEQQTNYRNAILEISRLTGSTPSALKLPNVSILPTLPDSAQEIREGINTQSYELLALRKDVESQQKQVSAEYSRYLPVLGVSLEKDTTENVRGTNAPWTDTRALFVMNWGFSLGGKEYFAGQQAAAELRNREAKLEDESQRTLQATEMDLALMQSTALRLQAALSEQSSALSVVEAVDAQLSTGRIGSLLEALDASERLFGARYRLIQALGQQMKAQAQLLSRLGQLSAIQSQAQL